MFAEIKNGMKKCKEIGRIPVSVSVDTWGVDFVLLDENDQILGDTVGYRDSRTHGMEDKVGEVISQEDLYQRTGIHWQMYNTIYQLQAIKETHPEYLKQARSILMTPDYFHFLLSGEKKMEYTIASTSQLLNAETGDWDWELLSMLGFPKEIFRPVSMPGTVAGHLTEAVQKEVGLTVKSSFLHPTTPDLRYLQCRQREKM